VFQNYRASKDGYRLGPNAVLHPVALPESTNYPLTLAITPGNDIRLKLIFDTRIVSSSDVRDVADDFPNVLTLLADVGSQKSIAEVLSQLPDARRGKMADAGSARSQSHRIAPVVAPRRDIEEKILRIWRSLIGREDIGIEDNFFDVGGQSILLVRAHRLIQQEIRRTFPLVSLLRFPTVRALADQLEPGNHGAKTASNPAAIASDRASKQREALARRFKR
jgi:hypothetical protein